MTIWKILGHILYWLAWPALFFYLRIGVRTRVAVFSGDNILVVKNWWGSGLWILPGGGLHRGEDHTEGALRELKEETGLSLSKADLKKPGTSRIRINGITHTYEFYTANIEKKLKPSPTKKIEIIDAKWMPLDQAKKDVPELSYLIK